MAKIIIVKLDKSRAQQNRISNFGIFYLNGTRICHKMRVQFGLAITDVIFVLAVSACRH